jgi:hypothetical protein
VAFPVSLSRRTVIAALAGLAALACALESFLATLAPARATTVLGSPTVAQIRSAVGRFTD